MIEFLTNELIEGRSIRSYDDHKHSMQDVIDAMLGDDMSAQFNELTLRIAVTINDDDLQKEAVTAYNKFITECCEWYINIHFDSFKEQYEYEGSTDEY